MKFSLATPAVYLKTLKGNANFVHLHSHFLAFFLGIPTPTRSLPFNLPYFILFLFALYPSLASLCLSSLCLSLSLIHLHKFRTLFLYLRLSKCHFLRLRECFDFWSATYFSSILHFHARSPLYFSTLNLSYFFSHKFSVVGLE